MAHDGDEHSTADAATNPLANTRLAEIVAVSFRAHRREAPDWWHRFEHQFDDPIFGCERINQCQFASGLVQANLMSAICD